MSLFRNENESAYVGGKKHWTDVIKNSGDGDLLIWRQPEEDFNTNSTLIVNEGEQAIFIKDGEIVKVFGPCRKKLSTKNYPFISRIKNAFSGGVSTFNCVVYFVRTAASKEIKWGTTSPIQMRDPVLGIQTSILSRGAYKIKISQADLFLREMIGNNVNYETQKGITKYFESQFQMYIKSLITQFINSSGVEILGVCANLMDVAIIIEPFLKRAFENYGISLVDFSIEALDIPMDDPERKTLEMAFAQKGVVKTLGSDWARVKAMEIYEKLAENPSSGGAASAGLGLGVGIASLSSFSNITNELFSNNAVETKTEDDKSETEVSLEKLKELKQALDLGLISQEDYDLAKQKFLS